MYELILMHMGASKGDHGKRTLPNAIVALSTYPHKNLNAQACGSCCLESTNAGRRGREGNRKRLIAGRRPLTFASEYVILVEMVGISRFEGGLLKCFRL